MNLIRISVAVIFPFLLVINASAGYIINEAGQVVPFKIYKKGNHGARLMCLLNPRNCRGGFHKRLTDVSDDQRTDNIYNFRVSKRNSPNIPNVKEREIARPIFDQDDDDIFDPRFDPKETNKEKASYIPEELKLLKEYNDELLSEYQRPLLMNSEGQLPMPDYVDSSLHVQNGQSENVNDIPETFNPRNNLQPLSSDFRYEQVWPEYSSDSSLSIKYPRQIGHTDRFSYLPSQIDGDVSRTGSQDILTGYDVTGYRPFQHRRHR